MLYLHVTQHRKSTTYASTCPEWFFWPSTFPSYAVEIVCGRTCFLQCVLWYCWPTYILFPIPRALAKNTAPARVVPAISRDFSGDLRQRTLQSAGSTAQNGAARICATQANLAGYFISRSQPFTAYLWGFIFSPAVQLTSVCRKMCVLEERQLQTTPVR